MPAENPRAACVEALLRWESGREFADEILHEELAAASLSAIDRAFLTELFYGVIRQKRLLDFLIGQLRDGEVDSRTHQTLRLGLYQIFSLRIPPHAAVNETVPLAGRARGLVNAVLRRSLREFAQLEQKIAVAPLEVRASHPTFLVERWRRNFGEANATALCEWNNSPPEIFVRANGLRVTRSELERASDAEPLEAHPQMLRVKRPPLPWIVHGLCYVQDPSTLLACELLAPQPGERVLDACAAPGGKTSYLAELMGNEGAIVACDASANRLARLQTNLARLGVENTRFEQIDWLAETGKQLGEFDRILIDAPCSNTGVMRRRVDVRWRLGADEFARMAGTQFHLVRALAPLLKPGGTLVYSTCSLEPEENEETAARLAAEIPGLRWIESRQVLPFRDGIDGAFAAKFVRV